MVWTLLTFFFSVLLAPITKSVALDCVRSADPEPSVQEQALALVRNFVDGCVYSVEHAFAEDGIILEAIGRQLQKSSKIEIGIQVGINF